MFGLNLGVGRFFNKIDELLKNSRMAIRYHLHIKLKVLMRFILTSYYHAVNYQSINKQGHGEMGSVGSALKYHEQAKLFEELSV